MATTLKPQLQFINSERSPQHDGQVFYCFSLLPAELRVMIWIYAMRRQRIINVFLQSGQVKIMEISSVGTSKWNWADIQSTDPHQTYGIFVEGHQLTSKFLRVSRESRYEALRFYYRVHIPCRLTSRPRDRNAEFINPADTKPGTFYFNPEYDILHISSFRPPRNRPGTFFFDFVHHLKTTYDRKKIGLLNLALSRSDIQELFRDRLSVPSEPFLQTISHLHEVFLLCFQRFGRMNHGWASGADNSDVRFSPSFPIMPSGPAFTRLEQDPRPIVEDLKELNITDSRMSYTVWRGLMRKWSIPRSSQASCQFLVACTHWS